MNRRITVQDWETTRHWEVSGPTEGAAAADLPAANATAAGETPAQHGTSRLSPKTDSRPGTATKDDQIPTHPGRTPGTPAPQPPAPIGRAGNRTRRERRDREASPTRNGTAATARDRTARRGFPSPEPDLRPGDKTTTTTRAPRTPRTRRARRDGALNDE